LSPSATQAITRRSLDPLHGSRSSSYPQSTTRDSFIHRDKSDIARGKSVMFSVHFEGGRTCYFTAEGHGGPDQDFLAMGMAQESRKPGSCRRGAIRTVHRMR